MFSQDRKRCARGVCVGVEREYEREVGKEIKAAGAVCYYIGREVGAEAL
jgi:hypothetical protein